MSYSIPSSEDTLRVNKKQLITSIGQCCSMIESEEVSLSCDAHSTVTPPSHPPVALVTAKGAKWQHTRLLVPSLAAPVRHFAISPVTHFTCHAERSFPDQLNWALQSRVRLPSSSAYSPAWMSVRLLVSLHRLISLLLSFCC